MACCKTRLDSNADSNAKDLNDVRPSRERSHLGFHQ